MKHFGWLLAAGAMVVAVGFMPFRGTDIARLQPVELVSLEKTRDGFCIRTDTGDRGTGKDLQATFQNLKDTTAGEVFLETAEFLLIGERELPWLRQLSGWLRPACKVCLIEQVPDLEEAVRFLRVHEPELTLQQWRAGLTGLPRLMIQEGRFYLIP